MLVARAPLRDLGRMLRSGQLTSLDLTEHVLARLDGEGRALNAVVTLLPERAIEAARVADDEISRGVDRGPLHGIPYGAKDLLAVAGAPTTWGAAPFRDQVFETDATVIQKLDYAGAILVAKLAMVELAGGMSYDQPDASITGPGLNPWDKTRWSGGSSNGSGSAVAARLVPFAIGSETQGSIISPASYCGVSGLRPTYGRVSRAGAMPLCWTLDKLGPLARSAEDCGLILDAIAGPDPLDPTTVAKRYGYGPALDRGRRARIGVISGATEGCDPAVAANFIAALDILRDFATLEEVDLPDLPFAEVTHIIIGSETLSSFDDLVAHGRIAELTAPRDRVGGYAYETILARDYLRALRIRTFIVRAMDELCSRYDALVAPGTVSVAPSATEPLSAAPRRRGVPIIAAGAAAGLPAICVPSGFSAAGDESPPLPTSIQFVGRALEENRVLAAARMYQERTQWHTRMP